MENHQDIQKYIFLQKQFYLLLNNQKYIYYYLKINYDYYNHLCINFYQYLNLHINIFHLDILISTYLDKKINYNFHNLLHIYYPLNINYMFDNYLCIAYLNLYLRINIFPKDIQICIFHHIKID